MDSDELDIAQVRELLDALGDSGPSDPRYRLIRAWVLAHRRKARALWQRGDIWWTRIWVPREHREWRESTGIRVSDDPNGRKAMIVARQRMVDVDKGKPTPDAQTTYADLRELILRDYELNGKKRKALLTRLLHLDPYFRDYKAARITSAVFDRYATERHNAGAANGSINRERDVLNRMFVLGVRAGLSIVAPYFTRLKEAPPHAGFFEAKEFAAVLAHLPNYLQPPMQTAYLTGWRLNEVLTRKPEHVDLNAGPGWLRLDPGESKTGKARMFPLAGGLRDLVVEQLRVSAERGSPWLFPSRLALLGYDDGRALTANVRFYRAWHDACEKAGVKGRIPHDFRRTAYRNLLRAGIPKPIAMAWIGHETDAMAKRYAIMDEGLFGEFSTRLTNAYGALPITENAMEIAPEGVALEGVAKLPELVCHDDGFPSTSLIGR